MRLKTPALSALVITVAISSCSRDELPVAPHESGNVTAMSVDMDLSYKYQIYYDLRTNTVVGQHEKTIWDIGIEASAGGYRVVLNGAKAMYAFATSKTEFAGVSLADSAGFAAGMRWDSHTGSMDSTAIGDWRALKPVYIIDRGMDEKGVHQGWAKLQMTDVTETSCHIRFASLPGGESRELTVQKDSLYNLAFVSFTTGEQVLVEPPKATWDLAFTQYTYVFYDQDPPTPYLVTGCLLNRNNTTAYIDTTTAFSDISLSTVETEMLTNDLNTIGYDWKVYTSSGAYVVLAGKSYIIRDADGILYKLHFTGFYNQSGVKGTPQWEYQQL